MQISEKKLITFDQDSHQYTEISSKIKPHFLRNDQLTF